MQPRHPPGRIDAGEETEDDGQQGWTLIRRDCVNFDCTYYQPDVDFPWILTLAMSMTEHDKGGAACPECGGRGLRPLVGTFISKTSRKS